MDHEKAVNLVRYILSLAEGNTTRSLYDEYSFFLENCSPFEVNYALDKYISTESDYDKIEKVAAKFIRACGKGLDSAKNDVIFPPFILLLQYENLKLNELRRVSTELYKAFVESYNSIGRTDETLRSKLQDNLSSYEGIIPHYQKIQHSLFAALERYANNINCIKLMWHIQNGLLETLKVLIKMLDAVPFDFSAFNKMYGEMYLKMGNLIYREEKILYPLAISMIPEEHFIELIPDVDEYGTAFGIDKNNFTGVDKMEKIETVPDGHNIELKTGKLTASQIDLVLTNLPVDITYVDENDHVKYFSQGKERIFPRSPGILGRSVQNCHPPKSMHVVQQIIDDFKARRRESAEFWIQMEGKFIHIRYFALFEQEQYKGVLEVSQEISHIRELEGEKRLLDDK